LNKKIIWLSLLGFIITSSVFLIRTMLNNSLFYGTESYHGFLPEEMFIPLILGLISILLLYLICDKLNLEEKFWFLTVFVMSPAFAGLFTSLNNQILVFPLLLLGLFFYLRKNTILFTVPFLLGLFLLIKNLLNFKLNLSFYVLTSELGNFYGVSGFALLLGLYGMTVYFSKNKNSILFIILTGGIGLIFLFEGLNIFFHLMMSYFTGYALNYLFEKKWSFEELKVGFFILILTSLAFSTLSNVVHLSNVPPYDSFELHLKDKLTNNDVIFTTEEMGVWIDHFSGSKTIIDETFFNSYDFKKLIDFFKVNNITHVIIPSYEKNKNLRDGEGLLFLMENSKKFEKRLTHKDLEIWKVKNEEN